MEMAVRCIRQRYLVPSLGVARYTVGRSSGFLKSALVTFAPNTFVSDLISRSADTPVESPATVCHAMSRMGKSMRRTPLISDAQAPPFLTLNLGANSKTVSDSVGRG